METRTHKHLKHLPVLRDELRLLPVIILRKHIEYHKVRPPIIIDISDINPHRSIRGMPHAILDLIGKGAISIVHIEIVRR